MPDFGAILRKARDGGVWGGAAGASGATLEKANVLKAHAGRDGGPIAEIQVGPLGPSACLGPTGPKAFQGLGPAWDTEETEWEQRLNDAGPSGPTGPSEKQDTRGNLAVSGTDRTAPSDIVGLPISPADVRAGIARELRALAEDGRTGPDALRDAVAITAAKIRNSPVLVERQAHDGQCHTCGARLDDARPVVAVMQAKGCGHLWMHGGECHEAHSRRRAALVDRIMATAGYGADAEGEAA